MNDRAPTISQLGSPSELPPQIVLWRVSTRRASISRSRVGTLYEAAGFTLARILPTQARVGVIEGLRA